MADTQLLPCPFCGGTDAFVERADYSSAFVVCDSRVDEHSVCMARGPIAVQDDDGEEIPGGAGAIAAWNRRAALASRPAEVDDEGLPPLPEQHEELRARWKCDSCDGRGHDGELHYQGEWQPPEPYPCGDCDGAGQVAIEAYTAEQYRQGQRDAVAADRARVEKPVAYAVVSKKSGIHKLCITRPSAERKAAVWREEWPDNGCTVRPLVFGDSAHSHTTNKEK